MDLILRRVRPSDRADGLFDIGIERGRIAAIEPSLVAEGREIDLDGRLVSPGLIETHIHLDKSCILDRCKAETGDLDEAIREVAAAKKKFTPEDVHARARRAKVGRTSPSGRLPTVPAGRTRSGAFTSRPTTRRSRG